MKPLSRLLIVLCQLTLLINPVWALHGNARRQPFLEQQRISQSQQRLPARQIAQMQGQIKITSSVNTPETILKRLQVANQLPPEVWPTLKIERSNTLNAATDGKNLMITDTLLAKLRSDDERAFVLSHELAHILLSHISKTQLRRTGLSLLDYLLERKVGANSLLATASRLGINLVDLKSSRGYEYQADDLGVQLMSKAGYNPQAAIQVFDILEANNPTGNTPGFLLSHPISRSRMEALVKKYKLSLQQGP
jgi:Zn-dependent protease with chaperone function